jgi:hypothetical protein
MDIPSQPKGDASTRLPVGLRLAIIGGSTAAGLGTRGRSFATIVVETLEDPEVLDLSLSGRMLDEHLGMASTIRAFRPDLTVICAGVSESMVHPGPGAQRIIERWAPSSWHGVSGLQARPYYSTKRLKRWRQRVISELKVAVKRTVIRASKGRSRMSPEDFGRNMTGLLELMEELHCKTVVVDLWHTDDRLFPKTDRAFQAASRELVAAVDKAESATRLPLRETLHYWDDFLDDHLHWNAAGHQHVAELVLEQIAALEFGSKPGHPDAADTGSPEVPKPAEPAGAVS